MLIQRGLYLPSSETRPDVILIGSVTGALVPILIMRTLGTLERVESISSSLTSSRVRGSPPEMSTSLTSGCSFRYPDARSSFLAVTLLERFPTVLLLVQWR